MRLLFVLFVLLLCSCYRQRPNGGKCSSSSREWKWNEIDVNILFLVLVSTAPTFPTPILNEGITSCFCCCCDCYKWLSNNNSGNSSSTSSNNKLLQFLAELQRTLKEHFVSRSIYWFDHILPSLQYLYIVHFSTALFNISSLMFSLRIANCHAACVCVRVCANVLISSTSKPPFFTSFF